MRSEFSRGPGEQSEFRQLQGQQLNRDAATAAANVGTQTQTSLDNLASRGGLRAGASERLMGRSNRDANTARQQVLGNRLNLDLQDEQTRLSGLQGLNTANLQAAQQQQGVQQYNIQNALTDTTQKRYADLEAYREQLQAHSAQKVADATPSSSGGKK